MSLAPGAIAEPIRAMAQDATRIGFRTWKVSEIEDITGPITACTKASALGTQVWAFVFPRSAPMNESYEGICD